jgi:hypothetical protein
MKNKTWQNIKDIFWNNTPMGFMWDSLFGEKKAKQAPPHFTNQFGHQIPSFGHIPPPPARRLTAKKAAPKGFSTSSLNIPPLNHIGKPLVIQNWDRIAGMATMVFGKRWFVVGALHTSNGYECTLASSQSINTITFYIYDTMYDSHRVSVYCRGRTEIMDVGVCKDPNRLLYELAYTFNEKFR